MELVQSLTNIELRISSVKLGFDELNLTNQPQFIVHEANQLLKQLEQMPEQHKVRLLEGWFDSYYLGIHWHEVAYVYGPFCIEKYGKGVDYSNALNYLDLDLESQLLLESYLDHRAVFEPTKLKGLGKMLGSFLTSKEIEVQTCSKPSNRGLNEKPDLGEELDKFSKASRLELRFEIEKRWTKAISMGDEQTYLRILEENVDRLRMPTRVKSSLQDRKYLAVSSNSIAARAAIAGGVSLQIVEALSIQHVREIEGCNSSKDIETLSYKIPLNYCKLVQRYNLRQHSPLIRLAIEKMRSNLSNKVSLTKIASQLDVTPEHLARQFKKETGHTVSKYTNRLKIQESLPFLAGKQLTVDALAEQLGFCSSAYFRKVFKDIMGSTPTQYANQSVND
ncbi:hypothetical protein VCO01S_23710 [Vibrio comitans NBRC 102076]|uniref:HTH araC/xylS-type domain-containing protein n=2 Tax=Vibrio comitans TaxID=413401 RepID=A0A4Y3IQS9_9VIBR|nr:hypothetical protein VCO01S_23710 [Vibrio comitans NBRC 102076]